jgi:hypothetical protein
MSKVTVYQYNLLGTNLGEPPFSGLLKLRPLPYAFRGILLVGRDIGRVDHDPNTGKFVAYYRVSTGRQGKSGLGRHVAVTLHAIRGCPGCATVAGIEDVL